MLIRIRIHHWQYFSRKHRLKKTPPPIQLEVSWMKKRKAIIVISLVAESVETPKETVEKEISEALLKAYPPIPWLKDVEKVTVTEK